MFEITVLSYPHQHALLNLPFLFPGIFCFEIITRLKKKQYYESG